MLITSVGVIANSLMQKMLKYPEIQINYCTEFCVNFAIDSKQLCRTCIRKKH